MTPHRRIRAQQASDIARGLSRHDLVHARALLRHTRTVLVAVARAGDDAMLTADQLRMELECAHIEAAQERAATDAIIAKISEEAVTKVMRGNLARIEAEVGERIAQAIETTRAHFIDRTDSHPEDLAALAYTDAAQIAREECYRGRPAWQDKVAR